MIATADTSYTERGLLAGIAQWPGDCTPRLIYADYLDENGRPEDARDQRLWVAQRRICCEPASDALRLEWATVAEMVPADEGALADVRRELERVSQHRPGHNGGTSTGMRDPMREWREAVNPLRAREAALSRTLSLHRQAEFVRVQVELSQPCKFQIDLGAVHSCQHCAALRILERELLTTRNVEEWGIPPLGPEWAERFGWQPPRTSDARNGGYVGFRINGTTIESGPDYANKLTFDRGFIGRITCDWPTWVQHGQRIAWHPEWAEECGCYEDRGRRPAQHCPTCGGTGRVPRPFTGVEMPVRELVLTTVPETSIRRGSPAGGNQLYMTINGVERPVTSLVADGSRIKEWCAAEWPGLTVRLPER